MILNDDLVSDPFSENFVNKLFTIGYWKTFNSDIGCHCLQNRVAITNSLPLSLANVLARGICKMDTQVRRQQDTNHKRHVR